MRKPTPSAGQAAPQAPDVDAGTIPASGPAAAPSAAPPPTDPAADTDASHDATAGSNGENAIEVRVLVAFEDHQPNDLVQVDGDEVGVLEREGKVDAHPDAVAYARSLKA